MLGWLVIFTPRTDQLLKVTDRLFHSKILGDMLNVKPLLPTRSIRNYLRVFALRPHHFILRHYRLLRGRMNRGSNDFQIRFPVEFFQTNFDLHINSSQRLPNEFGRSVNHENKSTISALS